MIMCVNLVQKDASNEWLISGDAGGAIRISSLNKNGDLGDCIMQIDIGVAPRSLDYMQDSILIGLSDGTITEVDITQGKAPESKELI